VANYLFIASTLRPFDGPTMSGPDVYDLMMKHKCWEVTSTSPHFKKMKPGDTLVFYLGGQKGRYIAGEAVIANEATAITDKSPVTFDRKQVPYFAWRIPLKNIRRYEAKKAGLDVIERLSFAKDSNVERKYIGLLLRNGCRVLTEGDLELIRAAVRG
jgi:hypothetical protein